MKAVPANAASTCNQIEFSSPVGIVLHEIVTQEIYVLILGNVGSWILGMDG